MKNTSVFSYIGPPYYQNRLRIKENVGYNIAQVITVIHTPNCFQQATARAGWQRVPTNRIGFVRIMITSDVILQAEALTIKWMSKFKEEN